jgi:dCMP deaminase
MYLKLYPCYTEQMAEQTPYKRPSWDEYFMKISEIAGSRATCDRGRSGSVAVRDKRILTTGYVGAPGGVKSCDDAGHEMHTVIQPDGTKTQHCIRGTHAEQNVIVQAARTGVSLVGGTIYVHMTPCYACAKMIINAGIVRVVALKDYHAGARSKEVFQEAGVAFELLSGEYETYPDQTDNE